MRHCTGWGSIFVEESMDDDFPAAHSQDTRWFAVR